MRLPDYVTEYRFDPVRRWRLDYAWPAYKVAVEVQGGIWVRGKHGRGSGIEKDQEKLNAAQVAGWIVLQCQPGRLGKLAPVIHAALEARGWEEDECPPADTPARYMP